MTECFSSRCRTDEEAERFVTEADLAEYDLSGFKPMRFEPRREDKTVSLRLPSELLEAAKQAAAREGIPYQRFMRHAIEQATPARRQARSAGIVGVRTDLPHQRAASTPTGPDRRRARASSGLRRQGRLGAVLQLPRHAVPAIPFLHTNNSEEFWDLARQVAS